MTGKSEKNKKTRKARETRLWSFDPSVFQPLPRARFLRRHIIGRMRSLAKYTLYSLAFAYPVLLVSVGVVLGGLSFWSALVGSFVLMWLIIRKAGYAKNFANWEVGSKKFLGLFGAFGIVLAFVYGLTHLGELFLPIFGGVLIIALIVGVRRFSER